MFGDIFSADAFASDFSFGFTTDIGAALDPEVTTNPGEIIVTFPPIDFPFDGNTAPNAVDDTAETTEDTPVTISVLANDSDADGDTVNLLAASNPANGTVVVDGDTVIYTPDSGFSGSDSFTYTVFDGFDFSEATVTVDVLEDEANPTTGDKSGFELTNVNDYFNPAWGGGFIATYEYTVSEASIIGDDLFAWTIDSSYSGDGTIVNVYMNGFNGPTTRSNDSSYDIGNIDAGFRPELNVGDTFSVSFQVNGAGFNGEHFCPTFLDSDPEPIETTSSDVAITAAPTNDWGSGFLQRVSIENLTADEIDGWSVILDVPEGDTFVFNNVWGATAETLDNGDILFSNLSWNEDIAAGGSVDFGFTGDNSTDDSVMIDALDFLWV